MTLITAVMNKVVGNPNPHQLFENKKPIATATRYSIACYDHTLLVGCVCVCVGWGEPV